MPTYSYACPACGHACDFVRRMRERAKPIRCPECNKPMQRDMGSETPFVITDKVQTIDDAKSQIERIRSGKRVTRPVVSKTLNRVPGIQKMTGQDGQLYAYFPTQADRKRALKQTGI